MTVLSAESMLPERPCRASVAIHAPMLVIAETIC